MSRIKIVTGPGTEQSGQELADAIQARFGMSAEVVNPPRPDLNPRDTERLGKLLDTLAVLDEVKADLKAQAERLITDHPELIRGSESLSLDQRIENTISNRENVAAVYGDGRPVHPPEQMILAGVETALGADAQHVGAVVALSAQVKSLPESTFRERLANPTVQKIDQLLHRSSLLGELIHKPAQPKPAVQPSEPERSKPKSR